MIYRVGSIQKELNYGMSKQRSTFSLLAGVGVFEGMLAFSAFFILQTLKRSVLADQASYYMQASYHTTLLIFLGVSYIGTALYNIVRFKAVSFAEVFANVWYAPLHLGYDVKRLVYSKIAVQLVSQYIIMMAGFLTTLAISSVMRFPFVPDYIWSMFFIALINTTALLVITMACSLLFRDISNARTMSGLCALLLVPVHFATGFFSLSVDRTRLSPFSNLFTQSSYVYILAAIICLCIAICVYKGSSEGRRYHPSMAQEGAAPAMPEGVTLAVRTDTQDQFMTAACKGLAKLYKPRRMNGVLSVLITAAMALVITAMLLVDAMLLVFSYASPAKETALLGFIPYVFQTSTMEPDVMYNDITFFEKVDQYVQINEGEVVLYKDKVYAVQVRRVISKYYDPDTGDPMLEVDIDSYPEGSVTGLLHDYIRQDAVYGRLVGVNRWLGVIVLFANTILGRILFMLVPTVLIFFNTQISEALTKKNRPVKAGD